MTDHVQHPRLWITLITLLGLGLRLFAYFHGEAFAYFTFGDEIMAYSQAVDYAAGEPQASYLSQANFLGNSKIPGSLWTVFWFNAMRLGGGPHAVAAAMLLLNMAVIPCVYLLGSRMLNRRAGLWAALFMATQPWAVYYSVGAYNPEIMSLMGTLTMLALWETVTQKRSLQIFWVGLLPLTALQFHAAAMPMIVCCAVLLWFNRRRLSWSALGLGFGAGLLFYLPYFLGEAATGWTNTRAMLGAASRSSFGCLKAITTPFSLLTAWCKRWTLPEFADYQAMGDAIFGSYLVMFFFKALGTLAAVWFIIALAHMSFRAWRQARGRPAEIFANDPALVFILTFILIPMLLFVLSLQNYSSRYSIFQLPILMMIPAICLTRLPTPRASAAILRTLVCITVAFNVIFLYAFFRYQGKLIAGDDKFLPSFKRLALVYEQLKTDAGPERPIAVTDQEFLQAHDDHDARAISLYIVVREKEARLRGLIDPAAPPAVYRLTPNTAAAQDNRAAYREADIMLIRQTENDWETNAAPGAAFQTPGGARVPHDRDGS